jgi:hypothetical protein
VLRSEELLAARALDGPAVLHQGLRFRLLQEPRGHWRFWPGHVSDVVR